MAKGSPFIKRLKAARSVAGISQKTLGIRAGIDEFSASARVNQYERGKHVPDFSTVERFAVVLEVPACYFYATDDEMAEWILLYGQLTRSERNRQLKLLKGKKPSN